MKQETRRKREGQVEEAKRMKKPKRSIEKGREFDVAKTRKKKQSKVRMKKYCVFTIEMQKQ
jgi:hypothetical protein